MSASACQRDPTRATLNWFGLDDQIKDIGTAVLEHLEEQTTIHLCCGLLNCKRACNEIGLPGSAKGLYEIDDKFKRALAINISIFCL